MPPRNSTRIINRASDSRRHERTPGWPRLGEPVALNVVNEYVSLYTKDQLQLVPQERPWGFTEEAEVLNGRLVRLASSPAAPPRRIDTHTPA